VCTLLVGYLLNMSAWVIEATKATGWNWFWGTWWPTIDWGNAPAWVGALLTSGSLYLAIHLLRRERAEKRLAAATKFSTWTSSTRHGVRSMDGKSYTVHFLRFYNANDAPIKAARVYGLIDDGEWGVVDLSSDKSDSDGGIVEGGSVGKGYLAARINRPSHEMIVGFDDPQGVRWHRYVDSNRYISHRNWRKIEARMDVDSMWLLGLGPIFPLSEFE
jgi:hypothetical protein